MTADLDTALLRSFVTAVRNGSIGRAAAVLGRTQPAVSQQIRRLEDVVGRPLLQRTARGVVLTPEGEALLPYAERILLLNDEAQQWIGQFRESGPRRIGLIEDIAMGYLAEALADFARVHPKLRLEISVADSAVLLPELMAGKLDLAIGDVLLFDAPARKQKRCPLVWEGASALDIRQRPLPVALFTGPCQWRKRTVEALNMTDLDWTIVFESSSLPALQAFVRAGLGLTALLPSNLQPGMDVLDGVDALPPPPAVDLGVYRRVGSEGDQSLDALETLLWRALG